MTLKKLPITGPWKGVLQDPPPPDDPTAFDDCNNVMIRDGRIQSRPNLSNFGTPPDNAAVMFMKSFVDAVGQVHTLVLTTQNAFFLTQNAGLPVYNQLTYPAFPNSQTNLAGTAQPYGTATILNKIFFCNGSVPICFADGESSIKIAGDVPGSCLYLDENVGHLIGAAWQEPMAGVTNSQFFNNRVRWSKVLDPSTWTTGFSSGSSDLFDVPDIITGVATLGTNTYVFRSDGVTVMFPTGIAVSPFDFQNMANAVAGVGNAQPYSLAKYHDMAFFVAKDDIWTIQNGAMNRIGGGNVTKIFTDIGNSSGGYIQGRVIPSLGPKYPYPSYWLSIPGIAGTGAATGATWIYSVKGQGWTKFSSSRGHLTFLGAVAVA